MTNISISCYLSKYLIAVNKEAKSKLPITIIAILIEVVKFNAARDQKWKNFEVSKITKGKVPAS